ncbi:MAG: DUF1830 domain-containing protein [Coleofasciculus sp. B1-GNL1-01]|uniref:DUF1830 domain-containing protein n=1 Tax=Coleofasciculus sp. B1-GNL1-01 TaxID=3068484 RepID=UPI0032FD9EA6
MTQILDPLPSDNQTHIVCCYVNATSQIQIARITNIPNWYFERVVFPGQRLVFEALPQALLEIHTGMMASAILSDTIPCTRLLVAQDGNPASSSDAKAVVPPTDDNKSSEKTISHNSPASKERLAVATAH